MPMASQGVPEPWDQDPEEENNKNTKTAQNVRTHTK